MIPFISLAIAIVALAIVIWWKFGNLSDLLSRPQNCRVKAQSDEMLAKLGKNVEECKARRTTDQFYAVPVPGQRDYLGRRKGGGGGWR